MPAWLVQPNMLFLIVKLRLLSGCRLFHSWAPANRDNPNRVGVTRRKTKALQGSRHQQRCRQVGKILSMLACPNGRQMLCGEVDANMLISIIEERMFTLYNEKNSEEPSLPTFRFHLVNGILYPKTRYQSWKKKSSQSQTKWPKF